MLIIMVVMNVMSNNDQYHQEEEEDELPSPKSMADYDRPNIRCFVNVSETRLIFLPEDRLKFFDGNFSFL